MSKYIIITLASLWLLIQLGFIGYYGISHGSDSGRYLGADVDFLQGEWPRGKSASYGGYGAYVVLSMILGFGQAGVVIGQILLSGLAAWCMYKLGQEMYGETAGVAAAFLFIAFLELPVWNVFILTESLFISLPIITTYVLMRKKWLISLLLITWIALLRPEGIVFAFATGSWGIYQLWRQRRRAWLVAIAALLIIALPAAIRIGGRYAAHEELIRHYSLGAVIWNYPPMYLRAPMHLELNTKTNNELIRIIDFAWHQPAYFARLAVSKVIVEIAHVRPFNNPIYNGMIIVTLWPLYALALLGWRLPARQIAPKFILSAWFCLKMLIVMITFSDWTGRFLLHVIPVVLIFAAAYVQHRTVAHPR